MCWPLESVIAGTLQLVHYDIVDVLWPVESTVLWHGTALLLTWLRTVYRFCLLFVAVIPPLAQRVLKHNTTYDRWYSNQTEFPQDVCFGC
jgi:hypothetical protein